MVYIICMELTCKLCKQFQDQFAYFKSKISKVRNQLLESPDLGIISGIGSTTIEGITSGEILFSANINGPYEKKDDNLIKFLINNVKPQKTDTWKKCKIGISFEQTNEKPKEPEPLFPE